MKYFKIIFIFLASYIGVLFVSYKTAYLLPIHKFEYALLVNIGCINAGILVASSIWILSYVRKGK